MAWDDDNKSTRDAQDDAVLKANTGATHGSIVEFDEHFTEFFYAYMDYNGTFNDKVDKIQATLIDILKALGGGSGPSGGGAGSPPAPGPTGPFGGGSGGGTPIDKLITAITKLDARMAGLAEQFETKTQKVMGTLTTNLSDLFKSEKNIKPTSGLIVGAGLGAGVGTIAPIIGTAIGAGIGGVAGLIVSAIAGTKEHGQKVEVINWDDFKFTPEEDVTLGSIIGDTLKGAAWLTMPTFMTEGLFGENKDQSFQISNWPDSGLPDIYKEIQHANVILNAINGAIGGSYIGERQEESPSRWAIPLVTAALLPITTTISAISGIIGWFRKETPPIATEAPTLMKALENLSNSTGLVKLEELNIQILGFVNNISQSSDMQELALVSISENIKNFASSFVQAIVLMQQEVKVLENIQQSIGGEKKWQPSTEQPRPDWPAGTKSPKGKGGTMSNEDAGEAWNNLEFEMGGDAGDDFWKGELDKWIENMDPDTGKSHFFDGGDIPGQTGVGENEDEVDVKATKGEFIVNKKAAQKNRGILEAINKDHFAAGGSVGFGHYFTGGIVELPVIMAAISSLAPAIPALATEIMALVPAFGALGPALTAFAASIYIAKTSIDVLTGGISLLAYIVVALVKATEIVSTAFVQLPLMLASGIVSAMNVVNDVMGKFASGDMYGAMATVANTLVGSLGKVGDTLFGWIPVIGGVFGQLTGIVTGAISAFASFMNTMTPFVAKLNPSIVENFNTQIGNLQATMGTAFTGIVSIMADTFQKMGGVLLPAAQELAPLFNDLGELLQSAILPIFKVLVTLVQVAIGPAQQAFSQLRSVVIEVVKSFVVIAAAIARLIGATGFLTTLFTNLSRPDSAGATAAGSTSINSFEGIAKDIAIAAAQASAGGGGTPRNPTDIMAEILAEISAIRDESIDEILDRAEEMFDNLIANVLEMWDDIQDAADDWFEGVVERMGPVISRILDRLWASIQEWLRAQFPTITNVPRDIQLIRDTAQSDPEGLARELYRDLRSLWE